VIAIDTSSMIAFLAGEMGADVEAVEASLDGKQAVLPPVVLAELLSAPKLDKSVADLFRQLPLLPVAEGYWERTGMLRAKVLSRGLRARLADALVAQSCIDNEVSLVARDSDFRHFVKLGGLKLT
jgi:predicted nucleic acid-binding protein